MDFVLDANRLLGLGFDANRLIEQCSHAFRLTNMTQRYGA